LTSAGERAGIFGLATLVVGVRLLLLAGRTRQLPEFLIGLAFLAGGMLGRGLIETGTFATSLPETLRVGLTVAVCILLAFFPPRAYVQRIAHRAARQES
jgi:hypothetical protein